MPTDHTDLYVDADITKAFTLPTDFYLSEQLFETNKEVIFAKSWQIAADRSDLEKNGQVLPFQFLPPLIEDPLLMTKDKYGEIRCLSNVCTHRGNLLIAEPGTKHVLSCGYHGRCFGLDGKFRSMPAFEGVEGFPCEDDHLTNIQQAAWGPFHFVSLDPTAPFEKTSNVLNERLYHLPLESMTLNEEFSKDYTINAHWALYCDNFLEGFHIPFVHPSLNEALENDSYEYHLFETGSLQIGIGKEGEPCFDLPKSHPDYGKNVYAYYYWLFPNIMLNFYPWGLSMNIILPVSPEETIVRYKTYFFDGVNSNRETNRIEQTEFEDQGIVEAVQKGLKSRHYKKGRFSPTMEKGVHHFHRLIHNALKA